MKTPSNESIRNAEGKERQPLRLTLNGSPVESMVDPRQTLLDYLRMERGLTGTKGACLEGECGSCYVLVDGRPINSCLMLALQARDCTVQTIEGVETDGRLHLIQEKFVQCGAVQCGYCTPGLVMAAKALLDAKPHPGPEEWLTALEGNICRCTGYNQIVTAVRLAAGEMEIRREK